MKLKDEQLNMTIQDFLSYTKSNSNIIDLNITIAKTVQDLLIRDP